MNKSLAVYYFELSADQGFAKAQEKYAMALLSELKDQANIELSVEYLRRAADQGLTSAQLHFEILLRQGRVIEQDLPRSARSFKIAADQDSVEGQFQYAICLLRGDGVSIDHQASEHYLRQAVQQGDVRAQIRLGICLLSGVFGRFDFDESRRLFDLASSSNRFAQFVRNSLCQFDYELITSSDFSSNGSIFSILRSSSDKSIPLIRLLNFQLNDCGEDDCDDLSVWQEVSRFQFEFLINLSQTQSNALQSFPSELLSSKSIWDIIGLIIRMYTIDCSLYKNVNQFLRRFPIKIIGKFMSELKGILHYIYLLQSSLKYCSHHHPLSHNLLVYRGFGSGGVRLAPLYESMIDEEIVWPSFRAHQLIEIV
jgi:hypothetical protein